MCYVGLLKAFSQSTNENIGMGDEGEMNARGFCLITDYESVLGNKYRSQSELLVVTGV